MTTLPSESETLAETLVETLVETLADAPELAPPDDCFLNDTWTLSWHDPNGADWTDKSYKPVATMSTVRDFWRVANTFSVDAWSSSSFFLMREHIAPMWEDAHNEHGGCWSMKVMRHHLADVWMNLMVSVLGETLVLPAHRTGMWSVVNGVSITPKRNFVIIRVWLADYEQRSRAMYALGAPEYTDVLFKRHVDNDAYGGKAPRPEERRKGGAAFMSS